MLTTLWDFLFGLRQKFNFTGPAFLGSKQVQLNSFPQKLFCATILLSIFLLLGSVVKLQKTMAKTMRRFLAIAYAMVFVFNTVNTSKVYNIHWNASNPIFRIDKTDNIIDVNAGNHPSEYDQVNIVCPVYKANLDESRQERYIIYLVSKEEFKSCRISQQNPRVIAVCNRPYDFMYFTITFRSFTPTPGGLEFHPGQLLEPQHEADFQGGCRRQECRKGRGREIRRQRRRQGRRCQDGGYRCQHSIPSLAPPNSTFSSAHRGLHCPD